jgi:hypothetical protein
VKGLEVSYVELAPITLLGRLAPNPAPVALSQRRARLQMFRVSQALGRLLSPRYGGETVNPSQELSYQSAPVRRCYSVEGWASGGRVSKEASDVVADGAWCTVEVRL